MPSGNGAKVFVVSDFLGPMAAGAGRAAMLLADGLCESGVPTHAFAVFGNPDRQGRLSQRVPVHLARIRRGCRWHVPQRCLNWQVRLASWRHSAEFIIVVGITCLTRMLLRTRLASRLAVWETTNANPGNKFIDAEGARNLHRCLAVLSPSAIIDRGIRETYGYQGPIVRLPFWIPDGPHTPRRDADRFAYDFAYVGRLDVEKGLNELISAFAGLLKKRLARLAICGFGKAEPFQARARALGIAASLDFKPNASEEAVEQVMRSARWYVLPSYHEGYPLGVLEAARQGMPIIAASVGSIPEMLAASEAGLLVPPRDGGALTRAMLLGLLEPEATYLRRCGEARSLFLRLSGAPSVRERLAAATLTLRTLSRKRQSGTSSQSGARR